MNQRLKQLVLGAGSVLVLNACHKEEIVKISQPLIQSGNVIKSDTLKGSVKGTMLSGKTYYFNSDITINDGDTLLMQSGVKLIALGDGKTAATAPEIFNHGTFISLGTKDQPNYITVKNAADLHTQATQQNYTNVFQGWWGGLVCTPAAATATNPAPQGGDVVIKWTHIEFAGSPAGANNETAVYKAGDPRYNIYFGNLKKNFIVEDSWFFGAKDDNVRIVGGKVSIMRNTFELCGGVGGEFVNMKSGTVGDLAFNMCIGAATNAIKASDSGTSGTQCNVNVYNNTIINGGYRQTKTGRGGGINYEAGARGLIYNNLLVNCRFSLRITKDADVANVIYGNQLFYGYSPAIVGQFYATDGIGDGKGVTKPTDILSITPQQNNPMFYGYDINAYNFTANPGPITSNLQPYNLLTIGNANFNLKEDVSPGIKKSKTDFLPLKAVTTTGNYGTTIMLPGKDLGAYQTDGTGNQH